MKLYYHPVSTTSRPIMLFAADQAIDLEYQLVDLVTGENYQVPFTGINPSQQVPVLQDGDFRLTESSAILKYLAESVGSSTYPTGLRKRARVNELMDWFNTGMCRDFAYGLVYPQIFPNHRRPDAAVQAGTLAWGREKARRWLTILDQEILGSKPYLCGNELTVADYFGIGVVSLGEVTRFEHTEWKNVSRWVATMKSRPNWNKVHEGFYLYLVAPYKDAPFVSVQAS